MSEQEPKTIETVVSSENPTTTSQQKNENLENTEKPKENQVKSSEQSSTPRITMPQDVRYATEPSDREKLIQTYNDYQISDTNACNIRFLTDNRQKKNLFGRNEGKRNRLNR